MFRRSVSSPLLLVAFAVTLAFAASFSTKNDPTQWTTEDVYRILNDSPWSKSVTVNSARPYLRSGNAGPWDERTPAGGMGPMGGPGGFGGEGSGRGRGRYPGPEQGHTVTVQWQSALPVRLAQLKADGRTPDLSTLKPLNEYLIGVIDLPKSDFQRQDPEISHDSPGDAEYCAHLKSITVLSFGHDRLTPTKVELNQGRDGRTVFHFERSPDTITAKDAEFRISGSRAEVRKKFLLKEMQFRGKLDL